MRSPRSSPSVYVGIVVGVGSLVGRGDRPNLALSIAATAVVAVAFQPVRDRVQRFANRLVYGARATPYEVLSDFADRMGGTYDAAELLPMMARTVGAGRGRGAGRRCGWPPAPDSSGRRPGRRAPDAAGTRPRSRAWTTLRGRPRGARCGTAASCSVRSPW